MEGKASMLGTNKRKCQNTITKSSQRVYFVTAIPPPPHTHTLIDTGDRSGGGGGRRSDSNRSHSSMPQRWYRLSASAVEQRACKTDTSQSASLMDVQVRTSRKENAAGGAFQEQGGTSSETTRSQDGPQSPHFCQRKKKRPRQSKKQVEGKENSCRILVVEDFPVSCCCIFCIFEIYHIQVRGTYCVFFKVVATALLAASGDGRTVARRAGVTVAFRRLSIVHLTINASTCYNAELRRLTQVKSHLSWPTTPPL